MRRSGHVVVIGGGFAGLSCAVSLSDRGIPVTVLESRRAMGGRAGSFVDEATGEVVDNGQHLFMACYRETRRFLARIGTDHQIRYQKNLTVPYLQAGMRTRLRCPPLPAPYHLLAGAVGLEGLTLSDRVAVLRAARALRRLRETDAIADLEAQSVTQWLDRLGQTENLRKWLWHPLAIATLNQAPGLAPASLLGRVLAEGFMRDRRSSGLGIATVGLGDLYTGASRRFLEARGSRVLTGSPVTALSISGGRVLAANTRDGDSIEGDLFVCAVPPQALARLGVDVPGLERFTSSPILSVNLWLDRPVEEVADFDFAGVVGARIQWLFNKARILRGRASHLAVVISAAGELTSSSNETLAGMAWQEVQSCLPAARAARLVRSMVVRERTATFSATVETEPLRPGMRSPYRNLLLAGDWTERGLPATIETAVRTGHSCADRISAHLLDRRAVS